jgi:hypothetical protein
MKITQVIKNYWPVLLIVVVFFLLFYDRTAEKELRKQLEKERDQLQLDITKKKVDINVLDARGDTLISRMKRDSIKYLESYRLSNAEIYRLNKIIREINFSKYTVPELDSIRHQLYSSKPLHSN